MVNFTPGPSELYFTVSDHAKRAFRDRIPTISHRSKVFESIFIEATSGLRELLGLPSGFHVAFVASATEIWERSIQSLVSESSFHAVNGAFSKKYFEISQQLGKKATSIEVPLGQGFQQLNIPQGQELIALTHNETSTGVSLPLSLLQSVRKANPESLIIVDAVSSLPYPEFDYSTFDSIYFSVQKGFGLPAGLGVWIYNDRCVERTEKLIADGQRTGTYHSLQSLHSFAKKNQTPGTPNVLGIYLLGKVIQDFLRRGITTIRRETEYKAAVLYQILEKHPELKAFVSNPEDRSKTVITISCQKGIKELASWLTQKGLHPGEGYGKLKESQIRIANFPAHSKEHFEALADALEEFH